jgi:hypothetical protein
MLRIPATDASVSPQFADSPYLYDFAPSTDAGGECSLQGAPWQMWAGNVELAEPQRIVALRSGSDGCLRITLDRVDPLRLTSSLAASPLDAGAPLLDAGLRVDGSIVDGAVVDQATELLDASEPDRRGLDAGAPLDASAERFDASMLFDDAAAAVDAGVPDAASLDGAEPLEAASEPPVLQSEPTYVCVPEDAFPFVEGDVISFEKPDEDRVDITSEQGDRVLTLLADTLPSIFVEGGIELRGQPRSDCPIETHESEPRSWRAAQVIADTAWGQLEVGVGESGQIVEDDLRIVLGVSAARREVLGNPAIWMSGYVLREEFER